MTRRLVGTIAVLLLGVVLSACGVRLGAGTDADISGKEVAVLAEKVFEDRPGTAPGTMTCGSLRATAGDRTRCTRVVESQDGTVVKLGVTATITDDGRPYRVSVAADDHAEEFGLTGDAVEKDLSRQYADRFGTEPDEVSCPYLRGQVGNQVTCRITAAGDQRDVVVTVDRVDPSTYDTHYVYRDR